MKNKKTLVIGASLNPDRYAYKAIKLLSDKGIDVQAYGRTPGRIDTIAIKSDFNNFTNVHTVTMYVSAKHQLELYYKIIALQPERVIFNPGTENIEFQELLQQAGIKAENACTLVLLTTGQY